MISLDAISTSILNLQVIDSLIDKEIWVFYPRFLARKSCVSTNIVLIVGKVTPRIPEDIACVGYHIQTA